MDPTGPCVNFSFIVNDLALLLTIASVAIIEYVGNVRMFEMRELTDSEKQRLNAAGVMTTTTVNNERGWSVEQVKTAVKDKGFSLKDLERALNLPTGTFYQSLRRRFPRGDKALAAFIDVHESEIWPNRYFVNGVSIDAAYKIEERSDAELDALNREFANPVTPRAITDWNEPPRTASVAVPADNVTGAERDETGRVVVAMPGDTPVVTLPAGMRFTHS